MNYCVLQGSDIPPSDCSNVSVTFIGANDTCSTAAQYLFIGLLDVALVNLFNDATCIPRFHIYVTASSGIFGDEVNNVAYMHAYVHSF